MLLTQPTAFETVHHCTGVSARMESSIDDDAAMVISFRKTAKGRKEEHQQISAVITGEEGRRGREEGEEERLLLQDEWTSGKTTAERETQNSYA